MAGSVWHNRGKAYPVWAGYAWLALVAALLNAATGFCLGCELYLIARRALPARTA